MSFPFGRLARSFACVTLLSPTLALAQNAERYLLQSGSVRLEISAPRDDIIRLRAGRDRLPEDASWAVDAAMRRPGVPLQVREGAAQVQLRTAALVLDIDRRSLAVQAHDLQGHAVFGDAPGAALRLDRPGFALRKAMPADAHYFGLGDKAGPLDRRGGAFVLWNTDAYGFGAATDPLYKSIPFVLQVDEQGASCGLFVDTTWRSSFDFGRAERDILLVGAEGGPLDYYLLAGPDPKAVLRQYAYLTGTAPLMPLWSLGFQQSHYSYKTEGEIQDIAARLRADRLPADVLYLDIDYQDRNRPFTVNTQAFPDLGALVRRLRAQGLHLVLITDLHIARAPGQGYAPYDTGTAAGWFVKNPDGSDYVGTVWPGAAVFPDFSRPAARAWWGGQYEAFVRMGVAGFWNDMNEPSIFQVRSKTMPLDTVHRIEEPGFAPRNASHAELHNVYGMLNSRATYEGLRTLAPDRRPFVLTRASAAGGQRYAATWTGDNSSSWAHLQLSIAQLANLGLSGFAYAGDDIGGFAGAAPAPELLTRWIQIGAFNPIFRDHYDNSKPPQEPWVHGPVHEDIRRRYLEERYRLMPYLYALAEENSRTGLPILRPVFLEFPQLAGRDAAAGGAGENAFLLGADLLVAPGPSLESPAPYPLHLPGAGPWYDYWSGRRVEGSDVVITPRLEVLPVYVRGGAVVPREPLVQSTDQIPQGDLELGVYPGPDCAGALYLDDGVSFAYQHGDFLRQALRCDAPAASVLRLQFAPREGHFPAWWHGFKVVVHGWTAAHAHARLDGRDVLASVDPQAQSVSIALPDVAQPATLTLDER